MSTREKILVGIVILQALAAGFSTRYAFKLGYNEGVDAVTNILIVPPEQPKNAVPEFNKTPGAIDL